jgi:pimeloyl-ACP methyl ester carboxylesterase
LAQLAAFLVGVGVLGARAGETAPVELETRDGVLLSATFFPAEDAGPDTPVVVMLAGENESPAVFNGLATRLQTADERDATAKPMSVLTVALRGLGDSTRVRGAGGEITDRRGARLTPADAAAMVKSDMEAVRSFLVDKNDAGELNLNRLGYVGIGLGSIVATSAAAVDWSVPVLSRGKQGRDVKALVLVSPPWKQLGLEMLPALRQPGVQSDIAFLITYGGDDKSVAGDVSRIVKQLEKGRPAPPRPAEGEEPTAPSVIDAPGTSRLQGSAWMKQAGRDGETAIIRFLDRTLAQPDYPWTLRRLK